VAFKGVEEQLAVIKRGVVEIFPEDELIQKLERSVKTRKPLRIKLGVDPTISDLHLGHAVPLRKLRAFQDLGHQAILIIGDYTAMVGDPSGQNKTRPQLTHEEVTGFAKSYLDQAGQIIEMKRTEILRNGEWFSLMRFTDVIRLASKMTVARMLERDDFEKRHREEVPIAVHEFLYPLMQGYDSVVVRSDVEIGGTDQKFNLLVGRDLQRDEGMEPQVALTLPMLPGTDGVKKMSKSLGNFIGICEPPNEMFGKIMSVPDNVMRLFFELASDEPMAEIDRLLASSANPRDIKVRLGKAIVRRYHSSEAADAAAAEFDRIFHERQLPSDIPEVKIPAAQMKDGKIWIAKLIVLCGFAPSNAEARRLVVQGGVTIDGETVSDAKLDIQPKDGMVLQVGKRKFARIRV
jgi:tyrosyl-tRNA synthetase